MYTIVEHFQYRNTDKINYLCVKENYIRIIDRPLHGKSEKSKYKKEQTTFKKFSYTCLKLPNKT